MSCLRLIATMRVSPRRLRRRIYPSSVRIGRERVLSAPFLLPIRQVCGSLVIRPSSMWSCSARSRRSRPHRSGSCRFCRPRPPSFSLSTHCCFLYHIVHWTRDLNPLALEAPQGRRSWSTLRTAGKVVARLSRCEARLNAIEDELDGEGGEEDAQDAREDVRSGLAQEVHDARGEEQRGEHEQQDDR